MLRELEFRFDIDDVPVSVPRRGFRSLLLPKGPLGARLVLSFSPPKGIQVFVTNTWVKGTSGLADKFQSPEGDSGLCYGS